MASSQNGPSRSQAQPSSILILPQISSPPAPPHGGGTSIDPGLQTPIYLHDLRSIADEIKESLAAAISELRLDMRDLTDRVNVVERVTERHDIAIRSTASSVDSHTLHLRDMQRHIEDLDNRGRRHNLRIRGMPEAIEGDQITLAVTAVFNNLLQRPPQTPIPMDRIHRALRPKGRENDPPRDIVCCLVDYKTKEEILKQARGQQQILHGSAPIQIYQDLSGITLQHRRDLKPLLDVLRERNIPYKWKFPFCLSASSQGRSALLKVPEDLPHFCDQLGIPMTQVPNWYAPFRHRSIHNATERESPMETQNSSFRRRRSPSAHNYRADYHRNRAPASPEPPQSRRARRGR